MSKKKRPGKAVSIILGNQPIRLEPGKIVGFLVEDNVRIALVSSNKRTFRAVISSPTDPEGVQRTINPHDKGIRIGEARDLLLKDKDRVRFKAFRSRSGEIEILILQSHFDSAVGDSRSSSRPRVDWETQSHSTRGHRFVD